MLIILAAAASAAVQPAPVPDAQVGAPAPLEIAQAPATEFDLADYAPSGGDGQSAGKPADPAQGPPSPAPAALPVPDRWAEDQARIRREAIRWETAYLALSVIDVAQTCDVLKRGGHEVNPIYGKHPGCGKVALIHAGMTAAQYAGFRILLKTNPKAARTAAIASVGLQGTVVVLNIRYSPKF